MRRRGGRSREHADESLTETPAADIASRNISAAMVGFSFGLGGVRVQVADVVLGDGAHFEDDRVLSDALVPAVHLALHIRPLDAPP